MKPLKESLDNILEYMLSLFTSANYGPRTDARNVRKKLPLTTLVADLFATFSWSLDLIRDNAENVRLWRDIDNAKGCVLDRLGNNFGVNRGGANDEFYRLLIRIKLLAQISGGDVETIISAIAGLYDIDSENIELEEVFPAKIQIAISEDVLPPENVELRDLVGILTKRLLGHGIGLDMVYVEEEETGEELFVGGRVVSEFTRIRLGTHSQEPPERIEGNVYLGGKVVSEFTRIRLKVSGV